MLERTKVWRVARIVTAITISAPALLQAQETCPNPAVLVLEGPRLWPSTVIPGSGQLRSASDLLATTCVDGSTDRAVAPTAITLRTSFHSAYPVDRNNGAVWDGRGLSLSAV